MARRKVPERERISEQVVTDLWEKEYEALMRHCEETDTSRSALGRVRLLDLVERDEVLLAHPAPGAPPTGDLPRTKRVSVSVSTEQKEQLTAYAERWHVSLRFMARQVLLKAIGYRHGEAG